MSVGSEASTANGSRREQAAIKNKREDQGNHECEVFGNGSELAESEYAWNKCTKNRGHLTFIPASGFALHHLPKDFQNPEVLEYVRTVAALTVRLRVGYTSWDRPGHVPFAHHRGSYEPHTGSGLVTDVIEHEGPCQCSDCTSSPSPHAFHKWYEVCVETALHVVYNTEEAKATWVDFFYDDEESVSNGRKKTLWAAEVKREYARGDFCSCVCVTHDHHLVTKLQEYLRRSTKTKFYGLSGRWMQAGWDHVCVMASHPHGQPKKITIGRLSNEHEITPAHRYYVYHLDTCPGSSGARGAVIDQHDFYNKRYRSLSWLPPHHGCISGNINKTTASVAGYVESESLSKLFEDMYFDPRALVSAIK